MMDSRCFLASRLLMCLAALVLIAGCATQSRTVKQIDRLSAVDEDNPRLLVMTPDVRYYLQTASGQNQPRADWTEEGRKNFKSSLEDFARMKEVDLVLIDDTSELSDEEIAYQKLYSAVGTTILTNYYGPLKLPTKQGSFDWTLGTGVQGVGEKYDAEYALFSYYRDYQASGGRVAFAVLAAAAGYSMQLGSESGFAALVDLRTGDIVWFNFVGQGVGELRNPSGAGVVVNQLFSDLPEN